jgi:D-alanine-D-alanine ligase
VAKKLTVGLIFGGRSGEHEVSLMSARTVLEALDKELYDVVPVGITKEGRWQLGDSALTLLRDSTSTDDLLADLHHRQATLLPSAGREALGSYHLDVVIPMVHGPYGEDGTLQGFLELARIPYVGSGVLSSSLAMDKSLMKDVFRQHAIPTVDSLLVSRSDWRDRPQDVVSLVRQKIGCPCFVKPSNLGSSVGISKVHNYQELPGAIEEAARFDRRLIVEKAVPHAREIEVSVLGNDAPITSLPGEIVPCNEFYDYAAKYVDDRSELFIPANLNPDLTMEFQRLAVSAFKALDCAGMARVDFFLSSEDGRIYVNEVNTIPGFTSVSMYPKLWRATGMGMDMLLSRLIALALERAHDKDSSRISWL